MIHMICGSTGAGKTTFALQLAQKHEAILFSIDEWMENLYGAERNETTELEWMLERIERCEKQIWEVCLQLLKNDKPVILDLGLSKKSHREKFYQLAKDINVEAILYFIDIDEETRWQRVQQRNLKKGKTFSLEVTREMFDFMESWFERPENIEHHNLNIVHYSE